MIKGLVSPLARIWKLNWADIHINSEHLVAVDPKTKKPLVVFSPPQKCEQALASLYQKISLQEKNVP
jgi:hypothetical protein